MRRETYGITSFLAADRRGGFEPQPLSPPLGYFCVFFVSLASAPLPWPVILLIMEQQSVMSPSAGQQCFIISAIFWKSPQGKENLAA
jgi:hypothetical protein